MYMLHKMSEVRGWRHEEMLDMDKCTFFRYYGYWLSERLMEQREVEEQKQEAERKQKRSQPRNYKPLNQI